MRNGFYFPTNHLIRIFLSFALLTICQCIIAQKTYDYTSTSNKGSGLLITTFTTPQGTIKTYLTDDLSAGKTISGTVEATPSGKTDKERNRNRTALNNFLIEIAGQKVNANDAIDAKGTKKFACNIPEMISPGANSLQLILDGKTVARTEIPISAISAPTPKKFSVPTGGMKGGLLEIKGPCDGVFSPDDYVKIGETILPVLAKSMYKEIFLNNCEKTGFTEIKCRENKIETTCSFRNMDLNMTAGNLSLRRDQTTNLHIVISGLEDLEEDKELELENNSSSVVELSDGNKQRVSIPFKSIGNDGTFVIDRTVTGVTPGSFAITGNIVWSDVCTSLYEISKLILINDGVTAIKEQPEVLDGQCHDPKDADEPGPETVIAVNNEGQAIKILAPKNVGTCPIEIYCVDEKGYKVPGTSVFLDPGEGIESYIPPFKLVEPPLPPVVIPPFPPIDINPNELKWVVARVVFQCSSRKEGTCRLQMDHWDQDYIIPRSKIKGSCDNKPISIGKAFLGSLNWIKNTGRCPVEIYSTKDGKIIAKPTPIAPGATLPLYNTRTHDDTVWMKCPANADGSCEIEVDSSRIHVAPLPEGQWVDATATYMVLKGECNGEESTISVTNGKEQILRGLKNLGTCPLEIYGMDESDSINFGYEIERDDKGGEKKVARTTPLTLGPGEESKSEYISDGMSNRIVLKCFKKDNSDNCSLQIGGRIVEYLAPKKNPPPAPKYKPLRLTIRGDCGEGFGEKKLISMLSGFDRTSIKWITNTGSCPVNIFCTGLDGRIIKSSIYRLEPGQTIESYIPPKNPMAIYFSCAGKADGKNCSIEMEHPLGY